MPRARRWIPLPVALITLGTLIATASAPAQAADTRPTLRLITADPTVTIVRYGPRAWLDAGVYVVWILIPGGIWIHHLGIQRLGRFRYGPNVFSFSMVALFGALASIFFAGIIKTIEVWFGISIFGPTFVENLFVFNLAIAAYSLLPIPPLAGSRIFFASRPLYVIVFASVAAYAILLYFKVFSYIIAIVVGIICWLLYLFYFEKGAWSF